MDVTPEVSVVVDELDLTDVPAARRHVVAATFERELTRLLEQHAPVPRELPVLDAPAVRARPDGDPVVFGAELARAVHVGLRRWAR